MSIYTVTFKDPDFNNTGTLDIKVYFKETDTHALLHRSFHLQGNSKVPATQILENLFKEGEFLGSHKNIV